MIKTKILLFFIIIILLIEAIMLISGYKLSINISPSLPYSVFLVKTKNFNHNSIKNGDFIQFINQDAKYYNGTNLTKKVFAKGGDILDIQIFNEIHNNIQGTITFNNKILKVKDRSMKGTKVNINNITKIPDNNYFVIGYNENSFDSRYTEFGLINEKEVIGVAKPLF